MLSDFLSFTYNVIVQFIPMLQFLCSLFIPLLLIGSTPHFIKKVTFFWK